MKDVTSAAEDPRPVLWAPARVTSNLRKWEVLDGAVPGFE